MPVSIPHLLHPVDQATFLSRYYAREALLIDRADPAYYAGMLSLDALDQIIGSTALSSEDLIVVDESRYIAPEEYSRDGGFVDALQVQRLYADGATISLRSMQTKLPALAALCRCAEQLFRCHCQANVYLTPPAAQGFKTHHDTHDVFILQMAGTKRWRVYEPVVRSPLPGQRYYWSRPPSPNPAMEFTLRPGDMFYCPRGVPHDARSTADASVHVSLGILAGTWAELLLEVVADVALRDAQLRAVLPVDVGSASRESVPSRVTELLQRVVRQARPQRILDSMADRFVSEHPTPLGAQVAVIREAATLAPESRVGVRPGLVFRLVERRNRVTLLCNGRRVSVPAFAAPSLRYALATPSFQVRELPGTLSESGKVVLIRRLMTEGAIIMPST